ncbi:hypothetical protein [Piscinibacter sp.]|uniref:hypothetical protein n=1 Tax=Piscinibacter sp. TaxID=1903157 RepID=UPI002ED3314D
MSPNWPWPVPWAPQWLQQPINPGWTFGNVIQVTNANSSAPEVEKEVVSRHSYGRQIGRMMDAMVAIAEATPAAAKDPRVKDLLALAQKIERIKVEAKERRSTELLEELRGLKRTDPKAWADLVARV